MASIFCQPEGLKEERECPCLTKKRTNSLLVQHQASVYLIKKITRLRVIFFYGISFLFLTRKSKLACMTKKLNLLLIAFLLLSLNGCSPWMRPKRDTEVFLEGQQHIVIMHPTVGNLKTLLHLTENGIFPLGDNYRIVGIYHQSASYDYGQSLEFIKKQRLDNIALLGLATKLSPGRLYQENELTIAFEEIFRQSEGIIFFGGPDIPPALYHQPTSLLTVITDPHRHYLELSLLFHLLGGSQNEDYKALLEENPDYPVLGICLGMQSMNVASGGTLIQDIPSQVYGRTNIEDLVSMEANLQHRNNYNHLQLDRSIERYSFHQIMTQPGSHLARIAEDPSLNPYVLSSHHQAVLQLGKDFQPTAWCMGKQIVEAIEHTRYPHVIGVQFHPEVTALYQPDQKLSFLPGEAPQHSFLDLYPGSKGENFHRNFWSYIAGMYHGMN